MKTTTPQTPKKTSTQAKRDRLTDFGPHWKTKITVSNSVIFLASRDEPVVLTDDGKVTSIQLKIIEGSEFGSSLKFIDWSAIRAVACDFIDPTLESENC